MNSREVVCCEARNLRSETDGSKNAHWLDDVVKRSFERLQKGVTEKAEEKLDAATEKSFAELEKELEYKNNDDGMPYRMEQDLLTDAEYKRNGYEYTTDHLGRLFTARETCI